MAGDTSESDTPEVTPEAFRFVRIDDISATNASEDGGADIDAIILTKPDDSVFYATDVEASQHGGDNGLQLDPTDILGPPDAFFEYPLVANCRVDDGFMSLGGEGGYAVLRMGADIEPGDDLTVLEVGGCDWDNGTETGRAFEEDIEVSISVSSAPDATWVKLGQGVGPELSFTIP